MSKCLPDQIDILEEEDAAKTMKVIESPQARKKHMQELVELGAEKTAGT